MDSCYTDLTRKILATLRRTVRALITTKCRIGLAAGTAVGTTCHSMIKLEALS